MSETYVVTGAGGGIGFETVRELHRRGERTIALVRDDASAATLRAGIGGDVRIVTCDLSSLAAVRETAAHLRAVAPRIDVLVNNAGVVPKRRIVTADGFERTWAVNVVAPFVLSQALLPALEDAPRPRVVNVGSDAHRSGRLVLDDLQFERRRFASWAAYAQSKLALVVLTREFARRVPAVAFNCVHPGAISTGIWRELPGVVRAILARVLPPASTGAIPVVRVACEPALAGVTGGYFAKNAEAEASAGARDGAVASALFDLLERTAGREGAPVAHGMASDA